MSAGIAQVEPIVSDPDTGASAAAQPGRWVGYAAALALVGAATLLAFLADNLISAPNVTLIFVLPVVIAAAAFGWRPALAAAVLGVLAFDFFFTVPYYSLRIASPSDVWAATLLLAIAGIVSSVAAQSRRRAIDAKAAAERAEALHDLAHLVVQSASAADVGQAAATAVSRIFQAPAAVLVRQRDRLDVAGLAGLAVLSPVDLEAAQWTVENRKPLHGDAYPFDTSAFDFWPICRAGAPEVVIGIGGLDRRDARPDDPTRYVELAGAYLAAGLTPPARRR